MKFTIYIFLLFILSACSQTTEPVCPMVDIETRGTISSDDRKIYNELIREYHSGNDFYHLIQTTSNAVNENFDFPHFTLDTVMIKDLISRNATPGIIPPGVRSPAVLITDDEVDCYFRSAISSVYYGWEKYYETYPDSRGILSFSLPGFDAEGKLAIVDYSAATGDLGAAGYIAVFQKQQGKWVALNRYIVWIS